MASNLLLPTVVILCTSLLKDVAGMQTFNEEPRYTEVNPGDSTILMCKVYNMKGECSWQKDGLPQGMFTGKYEWAGDRGSGDCSVRVLDVAEVDDGEWECQVTGSTFTAQDALTSNIARLVVRVAPDAPYMEVGHTAAVAGRNFTVVEDKPASIKCIARYGNPAARFRWFIGSEELPPHSYNLSNSTEADRPKLWRSESVLHTSYEKADHGRQVRCVAEHEAYDTKTLDVGVMLDVQYKPTVVIQGAPSEDIEEGVDSVSLRCVADSNPPANVMWRKVGDPSNVFSFQAAVDFTPASRKNSATYTCEARNNVGGSAPTSVNIDVKFPPTTAEVSPSTPLTAALHNRTVLECKAEGNPPPQYTWLQSAEGSDKLQVVGHNATLVIDPVAYKHQGMYLCVASNTIKGQERSVQSERIKLEVVGAPEVLRYSVRPSVQVERGQDALIQMYFCSDPQPNRVNWEWGSKQLESGNGDGRYVAETLSKVGGTGHDDCYATRLLVQHADKEDARKYFFNVENERGRDRYAVSLAVREPMSMTLVIGVVVACLALLVLVTLIVLYTFKTEKWCFARDSEFKPTDLESRSSNSDIENAKAQQQQTGTTNMRVTDPNSSLVRYSVTNNNEFVNAGHRSFAGVPSLSSIDLRAPSSVPTLPPNRAGSSINLSSNLVSSPYLAEPSNIQYSSLVSNVYRDNPYDSGHQNPMTYHQRSASYSCTQQMVGGSGGPQSDDAFVGKIGGGVVMSAAGLNAGDVGRIATINHSKKYNQYRGCMVNDGRLSPLDPSLLQQGSTISFSPSPNGDMMLPKSTLLKPGPKKQPPKVPPKPTSFGSSLNSSSFGASKSGNCGKSASNTPEYELTKISQMVMGTRQLSQEALRNRSTTTTTSIQRRDELSYQAQHFKNNPQHVLQQHKDDSISSNQATTFIEHQKQNQLNQDKLYQSEQHQQKNQQYLKYSHDENFSEVNNRNKSVTFSANSPQYISDQKKSALDFKFLKIQNSSSVTNKKVTKHEDKISDDKEFIRKDVSTSQSVQNRKRSVWEKLTNIAFKADNSSAGNKNKPIDKKDIKIISSPLEYHPNLQPANPFCYDNPSFLPSLQLPPQEECLQLQTISDKEGDTSSGPMSPSSDSEENDNKNCSYKTNNMNMKTTSSQTKINIHPITSTVHRQTSNAREVLQKPDNLASNSVLDEPKQASANGYITTSNVSTSAVVEVAKALRLRMQEQQKQKEQRHRYEMGNSSFRYSVGERINIIHSNAETNSDSFTGSTDGFISLQITPSNPPSMSKKVDSLDSSTSGYNSSNLGSLYSKDISLPQEKHNQVQDQDEIPYYFINTSKGNDTENRFSSFQSRQFHHSNILPDEDRNLKFSSLDDTTRSGISSIVTSHVRQSSLDNSRSTTNLLGKEDPVNSIVYAELSFPPNKSTTFKVFEPKNNKPKHSAKDEARTKYSTLKFPPPSPRKSRPLLASQF